MPIRTHATTDTLLYIYLPKKNSGARIQLGDCLDWMSKGSLEQVILQFCE